MNQPNSLDAARWVIQVVARLLDTVGGEETALAALLEEKYQWLQRAVGDLVKTRDRLREVENSRKRIQVNQYTPLKQLLETAVGFEGKLLVEPKLAHRVKYATEWLWSDPRYRSEGVGEQTLSCWIKSSNRMKH